MIACVRVYMFVCICIYACISETFLVCGRVGAVAMAYECYFVVLLEGVCGHLKPYKSQRILVI